MGFVTYVIGRGMLDSDILAVERAVSEYDERLYFDRNMDTGQFCIYLKTIPSEPDLPILGFDELPEPESAIRRLYAADTLRHGEEILDGMKRRNEERLEPFRKKTDEAEGEVAEALEVAYRKQGTHPVPRAFIPKGVSGGKDRADKSESSADS